MSGDAHADRTAKFQHAIKHLDCDFHLTQTTCVSATEGYSSRRAHSPDTNSRRIAPSLYSDLISDKDRFPQENTHYYWRKSGVEWWPASRVPVERPNGVVQRRPAARRRPLQKDIGPRRSHSAVLKPLMAR